MQGKNEGTARYTVAWYDGKAEQDITQNKVAWWASLPLEYGVFSRAVGSGKRRGRTTVQILQGASSHKTYRITRCVRHSTSASDASRGMAERYMTG